MAREIADKNLTDLQDVLKIQLSNGNWNYDAYMQGLANGLILGDAIINGKEPIYKDPPEEWLCEKSARAGFMKAMEMTLDGKRGK
jgi:hypothetical protein